MQEDELLRYLLEGLGLDATMDIADAALDPDYDPANLQRLPRSGGENEIDPVDVLRYLLSGGAGEPYDELLEAILPKRQARGFRAEGVPYRPETHGSPSDAQMWRR
jgi:hypothetical protein